jgi:dTDP-4-amino-4,6-dideoxygalactose transaminase
MPYYHLPRAMPYWNRATYRAIVHSIASRSVVDGPAIGALRSLLIGTYRVEDALLCGSGRLALEIALRACSIRPGDEVVLPAFCCSAIVPPILAVGALPVLADCDTELNLTAKTVDAAITKKTRAIVVPHLFGNPADIGAIVELARGKDVRVIDDAAQALGATIDGRLAGSFGDLGILSFGAEKICFGLGGGAVVSQNQNPLDEHARFDLALPLLLPTLRNLASTMVGRRWRRWTLPLLKLLSHEHFPDPEAPPGSYRKERLSNLNAAVARTLLQSLRENIAARRVRVRAYGELLGNEQSIELIPHRPGSACLTQVVRVLKSRRTEDRAVEVVDALGNAGYEVQGSYVPIHRLSHGSMSVWDNLSYADRVWPDLVELPCEPDVSLGQVERIATIVKATISR